MSDFPINCPNCGKRGAGEFSFGGELIPYPAGGVETLAENYERVWLRDNVQGQQVELWFHFAGCRRWIRLARDTLTNVS